MLYREQLRLHSARNVQCLLPFWKGTAGGFGVAGGVRVDRIVTDTKPMEQIYESKLLANEDGYVLPQSK